MKAIETTGSLNKSGILKLDKPLEVGKRQKVKIIILYEESDEINEIAWYGSASFNPAFDFLKDKKEDLYSLSDGKPFKR